MRELTPVRAGLLVVLFLATCGYLVLPFENGSAGLTLYYDAVAIAAIALAAAGVVQHRPHRRMGWILVVAGFGSWVLGELVWTFENDVLGLSMYPAPSDAVYLSSYALIAAGLLLMVRTRRGASDRTALLDACIIASGATVLAAVTIIQPLAVDSSLGLFAKLTSAAYPIGDVLLLAMAARLWSSPGAATTSYKLLALALGVTLAADIGFNVTALLGQDAPRWVDALWLVGYLLVAAAASVRSMRTLGEPAPDRELLIAPRRRLLVLTTGLVLPGVALAIDGPNGDGIAWEVVSVGAVVLSVLVVLRMAGLLEVVQVQAVQLAALARSDALTGAPNRRTWDHELSRACRTSRDTDQPLCVAILDLDHFKRYNDTHGHQAGDLMLRECVAAWTSDLGTRGMLARYGGEEFTVLLPQQTLDEAVLLIEGLRAVTPPGQTFSAGVAAWERGLEPGQALTRADDALYVAKRNGRNRVVAHRGGIVDPMAGLELPTFRMVVQPLVDIETKQVLGHEALCRFDTAGPDPAEVFRTAHDRGYGDLLEGAAIRAAVALPDRPTDGDLFVNASATALQSERFWAVVPDDLSGLVVELSEEPDSLTPGVLLALVARARSHGARIALDDLGSGAAELTRLAQLRPDVIKIDRGLIDGCAGDPGRQAVIGALVTYAHRLDVVVCAEGVERQSDLDQLRLLGVTCAQGYLLGRPGPGWARTPAVTARRTGTAPAALPAAR